MKKRLFIWKMLIGFLTYTSISISQAAGIPVWVFNPLTSTTISVPANNKAVIQYQVINQSTRFHTLVMESTIPGITPVVTDCDPRCNGSFCLPTRNSSCTLTLNIDGSQLASNLAIIPRFCEMGNPQMCYGPSQPLNITLTPAEVSLGGTITGLAGNLTLLLNGKESFISNTDGSYSFTSKLPVGSTYQVSIASQPDHQFCTLKTPSGVVNTPADIVVDVDCNTNAFSLGGFLTLPVNTGPVLVRNSDGQVLTLSEAGNFVFPGKIAEGAPYQVQISNPPGLACNVYDGKGTMGHGDFPNVSVICAHDGYPVSGTVTNLTGTLTLTLNDSESITLNNNGPITAVAKTNKAAQSNVGFVFSSLVPDNNPYTVAVQSSSPDEVCSCTSNCSGVSTGFPVSVGVSCQPIATTILSVTPTATIPVTSDRSLTSQNITITNIGTADALDVFIHFPSAWTGVQETVPFDCNRIPPGGTCTVTFSSTIPYVARSSTDASVATDSDLIVTGDNIVQNPKIALAFTIQDYLVWQVAINDLGVMQAQVIDKDDFTNIPWGALNIVTGTTNKLDGFANTKTIFLVETASGVTNSAGVSCYTSRNGGASVGEWYLPAICQLGGARQNAKCENLMKIANINSNLVQDKNFGNLVHPPIPPSTTTTYYWSSTESSTNPMNAWLETFTEPGRSPQIEIPKNAQDVINVSRINARCARTMNIP
ncbi:hypothetical protein BN59_03624 [Legionella massiliensis]|uniref:Uncharacterized protein n=1 Tax=Legionella massiliensis TaxID=1034943 RepID=A0A078L285_9GAMM|nr:hypothetical protein [Legionella massiliensis]CDZ79306.1 hypothetical protein BN59_03624 [Legionella massiliensis]CEE15044.1 hypothetical protein BN1094_03624 [Legionella massiliensis]